ncbi:hypothetical protein V8G61_09455 [Gaetbulibacter sp. M240]
MKRRIPEYNKLDSSVTAFLLKDKGIRYLEYSNLFHEITTSLPFS